MKLVLKGALAALLLASTATPALAQSTASAAGAATAKIIRPITVSKETDLAFGTLVRGAGTAAISTAGVRSVTGAVVALANTTATKAQFTIGGEGGQSITVDVPATITMTGPGSLTVTTVNDLTGAANAQQLSGSLGGAGSLIVNVGGSVTLTDATATGSYSGAFNVTANYN